MARKAPVSYAGLSLGTTQDRTGDLPSPEATSHTQPPPGKTGARTLKEASAHLMLYLHPAAAKALKRYALDQNVKVHDLLIEAVEDWFRAHGLQEHVRAETGRRPPEANR
jgi:hypothetical protein